MLILKGQVIDVEPISGQSAEGQSYAYTRAHVLSGREVHRVRLGDNFGASPRTGEQITAEVVVSAFKAKSGAMGVGMTALRPLHGDEAAAGAPAASAAGSKQGA